MPVRGPAHSLGDMLCKINMSPSVTAREKLSELNGQGQNPIDHDHQAGHGHREGEERWDLTLAMDWCSFCPPLPLS